MQLTTQRTPIKGVKFLTSIDPNPYKKGTWMVAHNSVYGIVLNTKDNPYFQVQIGWYESDHQTINDKTWYTEETMRGCNVKPLPMIIPGQTVVQMKKGTSLLLEDDNIHIFNGEEMFFIRGVTGTHYVASNPDETWLFPIENFPGTPILCLLSNHQQKVLAGVRQRQLEEAEANEEASLAWEIRLFLCNAIPCLFDGVELNYEEQKTLAQMMFKHPSFETIFQEDWQNYLHNLKKFQGWGLNEHDQHPFKVGDRIIQIKPNPDAPRGIDYHFGKVNDITFFPMKIHILWDQLKNQFHEPYSPDLQTEFSSICELYEYEVEHLFCSLLQSPEGEANRHIAVEYSQSHRYFNAAFGFSSKEKGKSWLKPIKKAIAKRLSYLQANLSGFGHPSMVFKDYRGELKHNQFYVIEVPKHKTFVGFYRNLCQLSELDFDKVNPDYGRNRPL